MKTVCVIGTGTMGTGIVQACAQAGYKVLMSDLETEAVSKAIDSVSWALEKLSAKGLLKGPAGEIAGRISKVESIEEAGSADLVIEAIIEDLDAKQELFIGLEKSCAENTVLGSNTSSIPITEIASVLKKPERAAGIHFFNPVHRMRLVEIVKGVLTSDETVSRIREFVISLEKEPVLVNRDSAGFIVNRINGMAFLEALRLLEKGIASAQDIDKAMRLGLGYPMGPFELMDMVGLDVVLAARMGIYNETREPAHFPPDILRKKVKAGQLGRKTGRGFYHYSDK